MRILFFNSSLELGRDGVGDYIRLLAKACQRLGHTCAVVALNDTFIAEPLENTERGLISLRLPSSLDWPSRLAKVRDLRERFQPDWISLHLVPYAFDKKGILLRLISILQKLIGPIPLHLMCHELWLGAGRPSPLRFHVIGQVQSLGIRRLLTRLRPRLVTASNPVYVAMLRSLGGSAEVLPLFGNVPVEKAGTLLPLAKLVPELELTEQNRGDRWVGVFFGTLHEEWEPEPFFSLLARAARSAGKRVCLVMLGRPGAAGQARWEQLSRTYSACFTFVLKGEQPTEVISALMQRSDFGIAASPWQLIGKSGTVAAMLDHGLPVIVTRDDFQPFLQGDQPPSSDPLVHRCDDHLEAKLVAGLPKQNPRARVDDVALQLCRRLSELSSGA